MAEPTPGPAPDAQLLLAALHQRFVAGLGERWAQVAQADDPALRRQALHRLAGAAGSYGFDEIGRRARAALELIDSQPAGLAVGPDVLAQALSELHAAVRRAQGPAPTGSAPS